MRKTILTILLILFMLFPSMSYARSIGFLIEEVDGDPADYVYKMKVTNGTLAIAGNVATLTIAGGGGAPVGAHYLVDLADGTLSAEIVVSANGKSLVTAADYAAMKALTGWYDATSDLDADLQTLASPTNWRLFYSNGSATITELALGTSGQYLKANGTTSAPTWDTPGGSGDVIGPGAHSANYVPQWSATPNNKTLVEGFAITAAGKAILDDAAASNQRTTLGLVIGTNVQAQDDELNDIAGLTFADDKIILGTGAGTIAMADCTVFAQSILDDADEATFKATVNLEAGTDFYNITSADTAFEAELNNSAGLADALSDETGYSAGALAMFNISPTIVTSLTMGSAVLSEPELEILDGATLSTTQINYLNAATGTTGTTNTNLVFSASPTFTGTAIFATINVGTLVMDASATPGWVFRDSDNPGTDKEIAKIYANFLSGADGAEDGGLYLQAMLGGSEVTWMQWDSDTEAITMGDSGTGEDLIIDFETATDNEVAVTTNSGATQINFGALNLITTGSLAGRPIITTADARTLTTKELSGGIVLVTTASEVSLPDVCDSATGACVLIVQRDASEKIEIGVIDTSDDMTLDGTALGANQEIDSPGGAGDAYSYICMVCVSTNMWASFGRRGPWVDGGAAD